MARILVLDTLKHPSNSGTANIVLSSDETTTMPTVNINGGQIDATTVGASTPSSVAATTLTASGVTTLNGNVTLGNASGDVITITGTIAGTLTVPALVVTNNTTVGGTLGVVGNSTVGGTSTISQSTGVASGTATKIVFTLTSHGLVDTNVIKFTSSTTLPTNIVAGTEYYVNDKTTDTFYVETSVDGGNVAYSSAGSGTLTVTRVSTFSVTGASTLTGNTTVGGTFGVTGASTLTGNTTVGGTLGVTGALTAATVNSVSIASSADGYSYLIGNLLPNISSHTGRNTGMGSQSMQDLTSGTHNACFGYAAGRDITTGTRNAIFGGAWAGNEVTEGDGNTIIGAEAGWDITTGSNNTVVGYQVADDLITGSNNTAIGHGAGSASLYPGGQLTGSNQVIIGNDSITHAYIKVAWTVTSDERDKADIVPMSHGLDIIENITPINYVWDARSSYWESEPDGSKKQSDNLRTGFSSQNIKAALDAVGYEGNSVVDSKDPESLKLTETNIIPFLVNAVKELSAKVKVLETA